MAKAAATEAERNVRKGLELLDEAADLFFHANVRTVKNHEPTTREAAAWKSRTCYLCETLDRLIREVKTDLLGEEEPK